MNAHRDLAFVVLGVCGIVVATFKYNLPSLGVLVESYVTESIVTIDSEYY